MKKTSDKTKSKNIFKGASFPWWYNALGLFFAILMPLTVLAVWQNPTANPPANNINDPLNTANTAQTKQGTLWISSGNAYLSNPNTYGFIVQNGNVGIGSTTPITTFVVDNAAGSANVLNVGTNRIVGLQQVPINNDEAASRYYVDFRTGGVGTTGIPHAVHAGATLYADGTNWATSSFLYNSGNNIGIGTTSPLSYSYNSNAQLVVSGPTWSNISIVANPANTSDVAFADGTVGTARYSGLIQYDHPNNRMNFYTNGTQKIAFDSTGQIGIGTQTPGAALHALAIPIISGAARYEAIFDENQVAAVGRGGGIALAQQGSILGGLYAYEEAAANTNAQLRFQTKTAGTVTDRMVITSAGYIGIGTMAPGALLEVNGANPFARIQSSANGYTYTRYGNTTANSYIGQEGSAGANILAAASPYAMVLNQANAYSMQFGTSNVIRMTILAAGNVGIASSTPSNTLSIDNVAGSANVLNVGTNRIVGLQQVPINNDEAASRYYVDFRTGGTGTTGIPHAVHTGTTLYADGTNWATSSVLYNDGTNIGIGVIPSLKFEVRGAMRLSDVGTANMYIYSIGNDSTAFLSLTASKVAVSKEWRLIHDGPTGALRFYDNAGGGFTRMTLDESGNVGIGTTIPNAKLHILTNTNGEGLRIESDVAGVERAPALQLWPKSASANERNWAVAAFADNAQGFSIQSSVAKGSNPYGGTTRFYIDGLTGNIGIGTQTPGAKLDVFDNSASGLATINLGSNGVSSYPTQLSFLNTANSVNGDGVGGRRVGLIEMQNVAGAAGQTGGNMNLYTHQANGSLKLPMTLYGTGNIVMDAGNVGISTNNPSVWLDVDGGTGNVIDASGGFMIGLNTGVPAANDYAVSYGLLKSMTGNGVAAATGNTNYTLRSDGTSWVASSLLYNNGTSIGIGTASPDYTLKVVKATPAGSQMALGYSATEATALMGWGGGALYIQTGTRYDTTNGWDRTNGLAAGNQGYSYFGADGSVSLGTITTGLSGNDVTSWNDNRFQMLANGNVGIGTNNPWQKFDVIDSGATNRAAIIRRGIQGSEAALPTTYGFPYLGIGGGEYKVSSMRTIGFGYTGAVQANYLYPAEIGYQETNTGGYTLGDLVFATRGVTTNTAPTERMRINSAGQVYIPGELKLGAGDVAENFVPDKQYPVGTVLVMADGEAKAVTACHSEYDRLVVGVISEKPAVNMGSETAIGKAPNGLVPIALVGVVKVKVNNSNGNIKRGDLLTTSAVSGEAMKTDDPKVGTIIGKALESSSSNHDSILALINLQ